jgi:predicted negative regulator of RcsB-dependent stress response
MAAYDLEEQEQLDELKTWWKMHGNLVTALVTAAAIGLAGWQGWNWWQRSQGAQASNLYAGIQQAYAQKDAKRARDMAGELIDKYSGTAYAGLGALLSAKIQDESGDAKTARAQLGWAAEHAKDDALRDLARLRLAALLLDDKDYDGAMKQLVAEPAAPFLPRFSELKGDILAVQGKTAEAKDAYEAALTKVDARQTSAAAHAPYRELLQTKLDALGGAK